MNLIIFDLETTGLSPYTHEIIQIAAVKLCTESWECGEKFETFVRPRQRVPSFITGFTGITQAHVQHAPEPVEALAQFSRFAGDAAVLVAHNGARFDMPFIRESCTRHRLAVREAQLVDSTKLSKKLWGGRGGHGLDAVMSRLGLNAQGVRRHDARGDVQLLAEAVRRMWQQLTPDSATSPVPHTIGVLPQLS